MKRQGRVLIVDDLEQWREELVETLQRAGFYADSASTIAQARLLLDKTFYHLLVLDIRMDNANQSNMDGFNLLHELDKRGLSESTKVIMLSGHGTLEQMRTAFRDFKVADFLSKDKFNNRVFLENVQQVFSNEVDINLDLEIHWQQVSGPEQLVLNLVVNGTRVKRDAALQNRLAIELDDLLCLLFHQAESLLVQPLTPGQSSMGVLSVQPFYSTGGGRAVVVKYGDFHTIEEEYRNFKQYVLPFIGGGRNTTILALRRTALLGGIVYSLLGASDDSLEDFDSFYHRASVPQIIDALNSLFFDTCSAWYASPSRLHPHNLTTDYLQLLDFNWERLEQALTKQLISVQGKQKLYFKSLNTERTFINPLLAAANQSFMRSTYTCTTHGDFNRHNIFADKSGNMWLIDFQGTGPGHILRDVARLDSEVRFRLLAEEDATLEERLKMEDALCSIDRFNQIEQLTTQLPTENIALAKAYATVVHLRTIARRLVARNPNNDISEYYIALLYHAMNTIRFTSLLASRQREHALLCASLLAEKLGLRA